MSTECDTARSMDYSDMIDKSARTVELSVILTGQTSHNHYNAMLLNTKSTLSILII